MAAGSLVSDVAFNALEVTSSWTDDPLRPESKNNSVPEGCLVFQAEPGAFIPWDNPDNIVSQTTQQWSDAVVGTVCLPVFFVLSASTNALNMLVFWKQGLKERVNLCLFHLSVVDFLHMFHAFVYNVDRFYRPFLQSVDSGVVFGFMVRYKLSEFRFLTYLSGFISMMIACERCFCVISPLRSQTVLSTRITASVLALATIFYVTTSLIIGSLWSLPCIWDPATNTTSVKLMISSFYIRNRKHVDPFFLFVMTIQPTTYLAVTVTTTTILAVKLKRMMAWREQASSGTLSSREVALTRMLIAVSVLYVLCTLPITALGLGIIFVPDLNSIGRHGNLALLLVDVVELANYMNGSFNFFIYWSLGSRYRSTLQALIKPGNAEVCMAKR